MKCALKLVDYLDHGYPIPVAVEPVAVPILKRYTAEAFTLNQRRSFGINGRDKYVFRF